MAERENITLRSEEVQEILGTPPSWLVRWGTLLGFATIVLLGWFAYWVSYPDVVQSELTVSSIDPPRRMLATQTDFVTDILVEHEDTVAAGQTLMVFRSSSNAKFGDVHVLEDHVLAVKGETETDLMGLNIPSNLLLGELEKAVFDFIEKRDYLRMLRTGRLEKLSISQLRQRIERERSNIRYEQQQLANLDKRLELVRERYIREQNLLNERLSTVDKVRQLQEEVLSYERMIQGIESLIKNKEFEIGIMGREIEGYRSGSDQDESSAAAELRESYASLVRAIEAYNKKHLVVSPIKGVVLLPKELREQQYVTERQELAIVVPLNTSGLVGRTMLDLSGSGKVHPGQKVIVKFRSYPFQEFGAVTGVVSYKAKIPTEKAIPAEITFPNGLITSTGYQLEMTQDMVGDAEIITEEKRILAWLFESLR